MKLFDPALLFPFIIDWIVPKSMLSKDLYNLSLNHANKRKFQQFSSSQLCLIKYCFLTFLRILPLISSHIKAYHAPMSS